MSCDTTFARIARPAAEVFAFVADPEMLSLWSFGTWAVEINDTGLICGRSILDGSITYVRIDPQPKLNLVDYLIGADPENLLPRIFIRIADGTTLGGHDKECGLMMSALRSDAMTDERWQALKTTHAFEASLIKSAIETGYDHRRTGE